MLGAGLPQVDRQNFEQQEKLHDDIVVADAIPSDAPCDHDDGLLRTAIPVMGLAYGSALIIALYTFAATSETVFVVVISGIYSLMYFGVPVLMTRIRTRRDTRWMGETPARRADRVEIFSGSIGRGEGLLQMVIVPVGVAFAFAAFSIVWILSGG